MAKVTADNLGDAIREALEEFGEGIKADVDNAISKVAKSGAQALQSESRAKFGGTGAYAKDWTYTIRKQSTGNNSAVIHNKEHYRLAHLLEYGHAKRGGGRVPGRVHIQTIEDEIIKNFESELTFIR